jgi:hypothetical protein
MFLGHFAVALVGLSQWLIVAWGYWADPSKGKGLNLTA